MPKFETYAEPYDGDYSFAVEHYMERKTIFRTKDYDLFYMPPSQRNVKQADVNKICQSILEIGFQDANAIQVRPYLIDPEMLDLPESEGPQIKLVILDGQHRFTALKNLGMQIPYIINEGLELEDISYLQAGSGTWSLNDYIEFHAQEELPAYQFLLKMRKEHKVSTSTMYNFEGAHQLGVGLNSDLVKDRIRSGTYTIPDYERMEEWVKFVVAWKEARKEAGEKGMGGHGMMMAWHFLFSHPKMSGEDLHKTLKRYCKYANFSPKFPGSCKRAALEHILEARNYKIHSQNKWYLTQIPGRDLNLVIPTGS